MASSELTRPTTGWDEPTKKLVKATVGRGLDNAALAQLEHISVTRGLDPLNNELYAIPKGKNTTFITSINGMLKVAAQQLDGIDVVFYDGQGSKFDVWLPKEPPAACGATVYRKGCSRGFTATVRFEDYRGSNLWQKMPSTMIRKVAMGAALRLGFSDLLAGLYVQEEMDQAGFQSPAPEQQQKPVEQPKNPFEELNEMTQTEREAHLAAAAARKLEKALQGEAVTDTTPPPSKASSQKAPAPAEAAKGPDIPYEPVVRDREAERARLKARQEAAKGPDDSLPERGDLTGALAALYKRAQMSGVTVRGWQTLERQCGGTITPGAATKALPALTDSTKVDLLNAGRKTTGEGFPD